VKAIACGCGGIASTKEAGGGGSAGTMSGGADLVWVRA
jgi:hypothetical protein